MLMLEEEDILDAEIHLTPPDDQNSDGDSGDEHIDTERNTFDNLSAAILNSEAGCTLHRPNGMRDNFPDEEDESDVQQKQPKKTFYKKTERDDRKWRKKDLPRNVNTHRPWIEKQSEVLQSDPSPTELFKLFFDEEVIMHIVTQSNLYARQDKGNHSWSMDEDDCYIFLAILLLSGYVPLPRRRMFWEKDADCQNAAVADAISRNKFYDIFSFIHLCDNSKINKNDRAAKIREFYSLINERCQKFMPLQRNICIDETMLPYYGRHPSKQFIRGKPIRYGFKLWTLATSNGYVIRFDPYTGASSSSTNLGLGPSVVLKLIESLPDLPFHLTFDNFFTSLPLIEELSRRGIEACGTIRSNRIENCPLIDPKKLKKDGRGSLDFRKDETTGLLVLEWHDNNIVTLATNADTIEPVCKARRWSREEKKFIDVPMPKAIQTYNESMGGVDRSDQNISYYRISMRSKKWWWPFFSYCIDMAVQNSWILYKKASTYEREPLDLLTFRRQIVKTLLMSHKRKILPRPLSRQQRSLKRRVPDDARYDGKNHFQCDMTTQKRCALCGKNTRRGCQKCNIGLHNHCFNVFHGAL